MTFQLSPIHESYRLTRLFALHVHEERRPASRRLHRGNDIPPLTVAAHELNIWLSLRFVSYECNRHQRTTHALRTIERNALRQFNKRPPQLVDLGISGGIHE